MADVDHDAILRHLHKAQELSRSGADDTEVEAQFLAAMLHSDLDTPAYVYRGKALDELAKENTQGALVFALLSISKELSDG